MKQISCVGIILQDYSNGTGKKTVRVSANISPDEAEYIFLQVKNGVEEFRFEQDKIFGENDENGRAKVTKLRLARAAKSKNGEPRKYPWYIEIGNGTGVKVKSDKGGYFIKGESYKESAKVYINISDLDFFKLMLRKGYLLLPIITLVGLMSAGKTASLSASIAILVSIVVSFFDKETRFTPVKLV
ncbi:MAG: hypothetical protein IKJ54_02055, partial [Anaerotignum sp.]|nr:hypothetical protein [Anaerotignum sp.]